MNRKSAFLLLLGILLLLLAGCSSPAPEPAKPAAPAEPEPPKIDYNEMVLIPAGECIIGGPADLEVTKSSSPPHKVMLKAYYIDKYEVTFEQYLTFTAESNYQAKGDWKKYLNLEKPLLPVYNVLREDARAYAKWAKKRLPTQEEWEKAAAWDDAAKQSRRYPWGNDYQAGWANDGTSNLINVGTSKKDVSFYGVHDMLGNIYEWVDSYYEAYPDCKLKDPNYRLKLAVVKGASIYISGKDYHLAARAAFPENTIRAMGFRCVKDAE